MTRTGRRDLKGGAVALGVLLLASGALWADWPLALRLFQNSNLNRAGWCYGYTIVWEGGRLAPALLTDKTLPTANTASRLDANVFFLHGSDLPRRVELRSREVHDLVSGPAIDDLAETLQRSEWPNPPEGTPAQQWRAYRDWLMRYRNGAKLIWDQASLTERMTTMPGGFVQPITVVRWNPGVIGKPIAHNVVLYIDDQSRLGVMDPNDVGHRVREATLEDWTLRYSILNQAGGFDRMSWNNVFFTREYVGRGRSFATDCERPVIWEWDPDEEWLGDLEDIPFDPEELLRSGAHIRPGYAVRSGSLSFGLQALDRTALSVVVSDIERRDSDAIKTEKIQQAVREIDPGEVEWKVIRWCDSYKPDCKEAKGWYVTFHHKECGSWVAVPTVANYSDVTTPFVEFLVQVEWTLPQAVLFEYGIAGGPAVDEKGYASVEAGGSSASTMTERGMTAGQITDDLFSQLEKQLGKGLERTSATTFRYLGSTFDSETRFSFDGGDSAIVVAGGGVNVLGNRPPEP